ncbi:MAG: two-component sensor histidine kinase [Dermatophilaceae bacterium]|nr:two-component sensor histidine kinase [Dermatophilaceae bacterium]
MASRQQSGASPADRAGSGRAVRPAVPDEVIRVLSVLPSATLVVAPDGQVIRASARANALGLVSRSTVTIPDIVHLIERVAVDGHAREQEMRVRRPPLGRELLELRVRVAALGTGAILVLIDDLAEERRVDVVRRDFVANVSHELKTPVGALALLAEAVLAASDDPDQVRHFAERMQVEAGRLSLLIQDVIDLSRLQGDDPLTHAEVIDVDDLVQRAIDEIGTLAARQEIELMSGEPSGAVVYGDPGQLLTALRNLLTNAISYSPGHTRVAVNARVSGSIVEIAVKDQGIGIPINDLDRIFERFYRVDQARSRITGGTGLGLAIVKHVCQNHGGECTVWSEPGVGSTFTLRLPAYHPSTPFDGRGHELVVNVLSVPSGEAHS